MSYKSIIKNRQVRLRLLRMLSWIPDPIMLKIQYRLQFGRKLDLKKPVRFTEKIQWYKLNYRNPDMIKCVDKFDVRDFLSKRGFSGVLTKGYGVYESPKQINLEELPDAFVLKDTLGGGGNAIIIVQDKSQADWKYISNKMQSWCATPLKRDGGREWPYYSGKKHRIFIEEYLDAPNGLNDYKFFCFNGKVEFVYCVSERTLGQGGKIHILNRDFEKLNVLRVGDEPGDSAVIMPLNYWKMVDVAEQIAKSFPHVRVDLYEHKGEIRFGELTFYNASGYMKYDPDEFDYEIGAKFVLPERKSRL